MLVLRYYFDCTISLATNLAVFTETLLWTTLTFPYLSFSFFFCFVLVFPYDRVVLCLLYFPFFYVLWLSCFLPSLSFCCVQFSLSTLLTIMWETLIQSQLRFRCNRPSKNGEILAAKEEGNTPTSSLSLIIAHTRLYEAPSVMYRIAKSMKGFSQKRRLL